MAPPAVGSPFTPIRPRKAWFVLPALVALAGVAAAAWLILTAFSGPGVQRAVVPGTANLDLEAGHHRIYYEYQSQIDGRRVFTGRAVPPLDVTLTSTATGEEVLLEVPSGRYSYESGSPTRRAGYSILGFEISAPGSYLLGADYGAGSGEPVVLAVRPAGRVSGVIGGVALATMALGLAIGITVVIDIRRGKARQRAAALLGQTAPHTDGFTAP
jgi:hypothetical protein